MFAGLHFSDQTGKVYYCNSITGFINDNSNEILGKLTKFGVKYGFDSTIEQINAWSDQILSLQKNGNK